MEDRLNELESEFVAQLRRFKRIKPSQSMMPEGITPNEGFALKMIERCSASGKQARPGIIAQHLSITKSGASQVLRSLGEKGLVAREQSKEDYRKATLSLTDAGKAKAAEMDELRVEQFHELIEQFGVDDFEKLIELLEKFATCMEEHKGAIADGTRA